LALRVPSPQPRSVAPRVAMPHAPTPPQTAPAVFPGFTAAQMHVVADMLALLRRNRALSLLEAAVVLAAVLAQQHETAFEVTERLLFIVCCLSNAFCLGCASCRRALPGGCIRRSRTLTTR